MAYATKEDINRIEKWLTIITWLIVFGLIFIKLSIADTQKYLFPLAEPIYTNNKILCTSWYSKLRTENGKTYEYKALNYPCKYGAKILSPANGIVIETKIDGYEGAIITIRFDDGMECTIAHLSKYFVLDNSRVKRGQVLALAGKSGRVTGAHIRVRFDKNGERQFASATTWGMAYRDFYYSPSKFDPSETKYYADKGDKDVS